MADRVADKKKIEKSCLGLAKRRMFATFAAPSSGRELKTHGTEIVSLVTDDRSVGGSLSEWER